MAEKRPTGEEIRQKMKEEYKQDLRKRKEFLDQVQEFKRTKTLSDAVVEIQSAGEDDTDVWVEKLNQESAISEAKMEMAMDSTNMDSVNPKKEVTAATDAEMRKIQAAELVRQMKAEMEAQNAPVNPPISQPKVETPPSLEKKSETPPPTDDDRPARKMMEDI